MGVGGSFDVVAGTVKRAPKWMQKCGLEWLYRVWQEPRRMFKRYLIGNLKFISLIFKYILWNDMLFHLYSNFKRFTFNAGSFTSVISNISKYKREREHLNNQPHYSN
jgi:hypothetical protein